MITTKEVTRMDFKGELGEVPIAAHGEKKLTLTVFLTSKRQVEIKYRVYSGIHLIMQTIDLGKASEKYTSIGAEEIVEEPV